MEQIKIKDQYGTLRYAYVVNEYLGAVSFREGYKIFRMKQKKPFIGTFFKSLDDCVGAINVFTEIYGEYFPIWDNDEWVDADVPAMLQYTVKNGINLYELIKKAEDDGCTILCRSLQELA